MARIKFPTDLTGLVKLNDKVIAKDTADGPASIIRAFLLENGIVLANDATALTDAQDADNIFSQAEKDGEEFSGERDNLFDPAWEDHIGTVQYLKKFYKNNIQKLGEWGVTVDGRGHINYPPDFTGRTVCVLALIAKHDSFPVGASPLKAYLEENEIDLAVNKTNTNDAVTADANFATQNALKEQKREERDTLSAPVAGHLRGTGQFLMEHFHKTPKKAGQWGYIVDDSPQADKIRDGVVPAATSKVLKSLNVGKEFINKSTKPLNLFAGETATGTPVVLQGGRAFVVIRGFGSMTVVNPDEEVDVAYEAVFNR